MFSNLQIDIEHLPSRVWSIIVSVWQYQILVIDGGPITISKIVSAIILLILGLILSRRLSHQFANRVIARFGLNSGAVEALRSLLFYVLVVSFALIALKVVNIPLTVFTVIGGALAIGIGFGSQNLANNFISGLLLLMEQPIRVGDLIDLDGTRGTVEHIGPRSTRVRTGDNIDIVVPNSHFLENNLVNWTLGDTTIRTKITVGIAYGSPVRKAEELLLKIAREHKGVLSHKDPIVFFNEFGDNALQFELLFWIRLISLVERRRIESDIRFAINDAFSQAGIVIAYPQRDLHLDSLSPIEVKVVT